MADDTRDQSIQPEAGEAEGGGEIFPVVRLEAALETPRGELAATQAALGEREAVLARLRDELAATVASYRQALIAANPEAVPELIAGASVAELTASLEAARAAFGRAREAAAARLRAGAVPAGFAGRGAPTVSLDALTPLAKIAEGLRGQG